MPPVHPSGSIRLFTCLAALMCLTCACKGRINAQNTDDNARNTSPNATSNASPGPNNATPNTMTVIPETTVMDPGAAGATLGGLKPLTSREYNQTLGTLFGLEGGISDVPEIGSKTLPMDGGSVFGNAFTQQKVSEVFVKGAGTFAEQLSAHMLGTPALRERVIPCVPQDSADTACYAQFVDTFSQRALRRPLQDDERAHLMTMFDYGQEDQDFDVAVHYAIQYFLQHAEFLYRDEQGSVSGANPKLYVLDEFQIATRMAFALWGEGPDEWLLEKAKGGELSVQTSRRDIAAQMLNDPRALRQIQHFHARWLGYDGIQLALPGDMRRESDLLVERVINAEEPDWRTLFTSKGTYLTDELAAHYTIAAPGSAEPTWVDYPADSQRAGILSHASFLSVRASVGKTSITKRGHFIAEHLLCKRIADPPPNIDTDERAPGIPEDACKQTEHDYLSDFNQAGLCAACHQQMDLVAMGLETFGPSGKMRQFEEGLDDPSIPREECVIRGEGSIPNIGTFSGPKQLGELLTGPDSEDILTSCAVRRAYQFAHGLDDEPLASPMTDYLFDVFEKSGYDWKAMLLAMVTSDAFIHRRDELDPAGEYWSDGTSIEPVSDPKDVDVEYAIRHTDIAPTIDGNCQEFVGAPVISWTGLNDSNNTGQDCWMTWSEGSDGATLHGCCTVRDTSVIAEHVGRTTDHDFSDDAKPNIFTDDHFTYMLSSSGGVFDRQTSQIVLTGSSTDTAIYDLFYNDGFYEGVGSDPVVEAKSSVKLAADGSQESWTVEYTAKTRFVASSQEGLDILCRFRITDVDEQGGELKSIMSFGDANNITAHQELRSCRLSTTPHRSVVP
jgi:hypothetical protein